MFNYYYETNNFEEYAKLTNDYEEYLERINMANNKVFSMYLIENLEHERFAKENEKLYRNYNSFNCRYGLNFRCCI
ncbi:hypothetical protein [Cetobacterium sp.]|uniref:hypothetical protein n=1 Tax=Cetobacterium sp. TaxID=2071632 RepID=UPI003F320D35